MFFKCLNWSHTKFHHLIIWMEPQEVNWSVRSQFIIDKFAQFSSSFQIIANFRDYEVSNLGMNTFFVSNIFQRLKYWVSIRNSYISSYEFLFTISLEIDCNTIQEFRHHINRFPCYVTI